VLAQIEEVEIAGIDLAQIAQGIYVNVSKFKIDFSNIAKLPELMDQPLNDQFITENSLNAGGGNGRNKLEQDW